MVLTATTNLGGQRLLLDTETIYSYIKPKLLDAKCLNKDMFSILYLPTEVFTLGAHNFGQHQFYPFETSPKLGATEGVLGVDFLKKTPLLHRLFQLRYLLPARFILTQVSPLIIPATRF